MQSAALDVYFPGQCRLFACGLHHRVVRQCERHAETYITGCRFRIIPSAHRQMAVGFGLVVTASAHDMLRTGICAARVGTGRQLVGTVEVVAPFGYVACHVIQP